MTEPSRFDRLKHVYHTRVRTTTVVLIVLWFVLLGVYNFTSQHYPPKDAAKPTRTTGQQTRTPEPSPTTESTSRTQTPTSSVEQTTESTTATTAPEQEETRAPNREQPRRTAPLQTQLSTEQVEPSSDSDTSSGGDGR